MELQRKYGWRPEFPDHRDFTFVAQPSTVLPDFVDLRPFCSKVEDQGNLGSCTAQALVGALEVLEVKKWKKYLDLSRLFVYYNERVLEDTVDDDAGAMIRDGIKTLASQGVCIESLWPYQITQFTKKPPPGAFTEALLHKIISYHKLNGLCDMQYALAEGYPFVFGFSVYDSFESRQVAETGIVPMPKRNESFLGGHAVLAVGYDQKKKWFTVRNSWGREWGDKGYFYIPFDFVSNPGLASDFWVIHTANV